MSSKQENYNPFKIKESISFVCQRFNRVTKFVYSKWFEPKSISSSCHVIVRVSVVLKRTVGDSD